MIIDQRFHASALTWALAISISAVALSAASVTHAQDAAGYPSKQIQVIVPFPAGVGVDVVIRIIGPRLAARACSH